jgi:hypothetical protein
MIHGAGFDCRRVPLSGSAPGWAGDLMLAGRMFEVKTRARGLRRLYRWLDERYFGLVVAADRREPLIIFRLGNFLRDCRFRESSGTSRSKTLPAVFGRSGAPRPRGRARSGPPVSRESGEGHS